MRTAAAAGGQEAAQFTAPFSLFLLKKPPDALSYAAALLISHHGPQFPFGAISSTSQSAHCQERVKKTSKGIV